jgi:hypothetical protein
MRMVLIAGLCMLGGCTVDGIEHDASQALGATRLTDQYTIERSSRWRVYDSDGIAMDANYDPSDERQLRLLRAAYDGVMRVYPRATLDPTPKALAAPDASTRSVALRLHVDIPPHGGGALGFAVALVDAQTGGVIDRATLAVRSSWWGGAEDPAAISRLFCDYALQLRPLR